MKTPDETKKRSEHFDEKRMCIEKCFADVLAYIQKLGETIGNLGRLNGTMYNEAKKGIQELESRLAQVERERDAAVGDLTKAMLLDGVEGCSFCKNIKKPYCHPCKFEWRGVCEENTKEDGNAPDNPAAP